MKKNTYSILNPWGTTTASVTEMEMIPLSMIPFPNNWWYSMWRHRAFGNLSLLEVVLNL